MACMQKRSSDFGGPAQRNGLDERGWSKRRTRLASRYYERKEVNVKESGAFTKQESSRQASRKRRERGSVWGGRRKGEVTQINRVQRGKSRIIWVLSIFRRATSACPQIRALDFFLSGQGGSRRRCGRQTGMAKAARVSRCTSQDGRRPVPLPQPAKRPSPSPARSCHQAAAV